MYSLADLSVKFMNMDPEHQAQVFNEITTNIHIYNQIMPQLPLIKYIVGGEEAVPATAHGPIITAYKAWRSAQQGE